jgi:7-carboxy-7-deazaguanine synthase
MKYPVAERFKSLQGEGVYTGVPMAFIRLVGCSVGQRVCTHCDTDFDKVYYGLGGGLYTPEELVDWADDYRILNITGGEPLDRDLVPLIRHAWERNKRIHIETSGTVMLDPIRHSAPNWVCVSPKPGYLPAMIARADEIKVIHRGLGDGPGWPTLQDALDWAERRIVYLQPRNYKNQPNEENTLEVVNLVKQHPTLRASFQLHKIINER